MKKYMKCIALLLSLSLLTVSFAGCRSSKGNESGTDSDEFEWVYESGETGSDNNASGNGESNVSGNNAGTGSNAGGTTSQGNTPGGNGGGTTTSNVTTKGKTFTIISTYLSPKRTNGMDLYAELFLERAEEVEKELGCTIKIVNTVYPTPEWLAPQIQAGKKVADLLHVEMRQLVPFVSAGYVKAWSDVPSINVKQADFNQGITKVSTINGKTYALSMLKPEEVRYCGAINKTLLKQYGINPDDIYAKVNNGTWNFDALTEYATKLKNNDSFKGEAITATADYLIEMLMAANNGRIVTMNGNKATPTYNSNNVKTAANYMYDLVHKYNVYDPNGKGDFSKGNVGFYFCESWEFAKKMKPNVKSFDYAMIPVPKGPNASDYTSSLEHANIFMITSTNKEEAFTAKVLTALAKAPDKQSGNQWWLDEVQLDLFQKNDTQSMDVYKMLLNSASIDLGLCVPTLTTQFKDTVLKNAIIDNKTSVSAAFDSINGKLDGTINDVFKNIGKK